MRILSSMMFLIVFLVVFFSISKESILTAYDCETFCTNVYEGIKEIKACKTGCEHGMSSNGDNKVTDEVSSDTGNIKGVITWQYNKYVGTKPDNGAIIYLFPDQPVNLIHNDEINIFSPIMIGSTGITENTRMIEKKTGIYIAIADGYGHYEIQDIPSGEYTTLIVSRETDRDFMNESIDDHKELNVMLRKYVDGEMPEYLKSKFVCSVKIENCNFCDEPYKKYKYEDISKLPVSANAECRRQLKMVLVMNFTFLNKYTLKNKVVISPNRTIDISHDFGYTY